MNKICKLSAIALLASSTSLMAQSKSFEGASLGLSVSGIGVEVSGSHSPSAAGTGQTSDRTSGSLGKVAEIAAIDLSYGFAIGNNGIIQVGASYTPGKAKAGSGTYTDGTTNTEGSGLNAGTGNLSLEVKDPYTIYIAPTYVVSKDSAIYAKVGYAKADINTAATGGATLSRKPEDLEGMSYGIGSKTMLTQNLYLGVEANITDYDSVKATTQANAGNGGTSSKTITADVKTVQGTITLGYKF
jgi:hypothetical protein